MDDSGLRLPASIPLGPGREFDLVRGFIRRWGDHARGIGDDAAVVDVPLGSQLVVSTDTAIEHIHFRREWLSPTEIGYRAAAAALSDLAAMAASPLGMLIAMTIPAALEGQAAAIADGLGEAARSLECPILGGDTSRGELVALTITVLGHGQHLVRRSGAAPGDLVYVTGRLGGAGAALAALRAAAPLLPAYRLRFAHPIPRLNEAVWLAQRGASAMIDISDGLASEARHLAAANGNTMAIELERLPLMEGVSSRAAAVSGEEYELLLTAPRLFDEGDFARAFDVPLTMIGRVTVGSPQALFYEAGAIVDLGSGYDHFSL
jgi:thiamine-monophosphate kinase